MKEQPKYQKFMEMKDRTKYVNEQVQGEAKSIDFILNHKFSEEGFIEHLGTQSKATIKLHTYR